MTYEYECNGCEHKFETEQRIKDDPLKVCPVCGEPKLQRVIPRRENHGNGFSLSGPRWERDGYSG